MPEKVEQPQEEVPEVTKSPEELVEIIGKPAMSQEELKKLAELKRLKREKKKKEKAEQ